jgi:curli production assembly/transport component CsgF
MQTFRNTIIGLLALISMTATSSELVYTPLNPTFGGNPMLGSFLLSKAQAQNEHTNDDSNSLDRFESRLENAILSQLARQIVDAAFNGGSFGDGESSFTTGNFTVTILEIADVMIIVEITNNLTGEVTVIEIPVFGDGGY